MVLFAENTTVDGCTPSTVPLDQTTRHEKTNTGQASTKLLHSAIRTPESFSNTPLIDLALVRDCIVPPAPILSNEEYNGGVERRYAQSYERYRAARPAMDSPTSLSTGATGSRSTAYSNVNSPAASPPFFISARKDGELSKPSTSDSARSPKRMRFQSSYALNSPRDLSMPPPTSLPSYTSEKFDRLVDTGYTSTPLTPASSTSDDGYKPYPSMLLPNLSREMSDLRRLSVSSLLSGPPGMPVTGSSQSVQDWSVRYQDDTTTYGIDRGFKDLDVGKNDDMSAILGTSPVRLRDHLDLVLDQDGEPVEPGFTTDAAVANGSYYDKPVAVSIPRAFEPLPSKLLENPMNLLYFHHFIDHTAGCLVPHNCSSNPFKSILPQMAVQDDNLLNLLLAYSASHRARLLRQPEPAVRIALWVRDIFPHLRMALDNPSEIISNSNLATAIMLASLEIISPKAFGVEVPWQNHLDTARQMIAARGGPHKVKTASRGDKVSSFLWSWFAYLDVLGSLSGGKANSSTLVSFLFTLRIAQN